MAVKDYSTTNLENQTVGSVNFVEGQGANTLNNSDREVMVDMKNGTVVNADNYAAMTALEKSKQADDATIRCLGKTTVGDGLGGLFYWDSASSATDDGDTVLAADEGGTGRWIAIESTYVDKVVTVTDPTVTTAGAAIGIGNHKTSYYRVDAQPENTTKQWFKFTLADLGDIAGGLHVVALCDMTGGISSGYSVAEFRFGQETDGGGPSARVISVLSSDFIAIAAPVVSGDDVIFGGEIPNNGTAHTGVVHLYITTTFDLESNFVFTGLDGTTAHTGASLKDTVAVNWDLKPLTDNIYDIGDATHRFVDIYATNATIQTSTIKVKEQVNPLQDELIAALSSVESKTFKMKKDVSNEAAGEGKARTHVGPILEDVHAALQAAGLDPDDYDFLIGDGGFRPTEVLFLQLEALRKDVEALKNAP